MSNTSTLKPNLSTLPNINESSIMTNRAQYAIVALLKLNKHKEKEQPVSLAMIANEENISISYLEQLFSGLRKHSIVKSFRGPGGGYILAKPANEIAISDIMIAAEDCTPAKRNKKKTLQEREGPTALLWGKLNNVLLDVAKDISLNDVANSNTKIN